MTNKPNLPQEEQSPLSAAAGDEKQKKHFPLRLLMRLFTLLISIALILGAVMLVAYRDTYNIDALRRWLAYRDLQATETGELTPFVHAGGDEMDFARISSGIVMASRAGAHFYAPSGTPYAEHVSALAHPVLTSSDSTAVVYDAGGQSLYLFQNKEMPFSLSLPSGNEILSARTNDAGWLVVTAQKSGYKGSVTIYNSKFEVVMDINLSSAFIMDAAISPDGKSVAIITIGQENGIFHSTLQCYDVGKKEPVATLSLSDTVVLDMEYETDQIWIVGDKSLLSISPDASSQHTYPYGDFHLKGYTLGGDDFGALLLSEYAAGDPDVLVTVNTDGKAIDTVNLIGPIPALDAHGDYLSTLSVDGVTIYAIRTGDSAKTLIPYSQLTHTNGAQTIAQSADGSVMLASSQEAWIYLPNE